MPGYRWLRPLLWTGAVALLLCLLALVGLGTALQSAPWPDIKPGQRLGQDSGRVQKLIDRQRIVLLMQGQPIALHLPARDLSATADDLAWRVLSGGGRIVLGQGSAQAWLSVPVQRTPLRSLSLLGDWINLQGEVHQSSSGVPQLTHLQIGPIALPPGLVLWAIERAAEHHGLHELVKVGLDTVKQVRLTPLEAGVSLHWDATLRGRTLMALIPPPDRLRVQVYQAELARLLPTTADLPIWERYKPVPLVKVLNPMFQLAQQRSVAVMLATQEGEQENPAALENRAALLAMTLHALQSQLASLSAPPQATATEPNGRRLLLHGREDFAQHFLLSALLASGMGGRLTDIVGTYKELSDETGGSGFSFNDLAADRSGVRFGQKALQDPLALQRRAVVGDTDDFFMPDVRDLPEYLTPAQFREQYGSVGSPQYNSVMDDIEQRISRLGVLTGS